jgi:hypothetical protein
MGWPTDEQIDQAAETLCRMAEIPGLERGRAIFKPDFKRVEWYSPLWNTSGFEDYPYDLEAHIPHGPSYDSRSELFKACKWEIDDALWAQKHQVEAALPPLFEVMKERGPSPDAMQPDDLRQWADLIGDDDWRRRIDDEWPPLTETGGEGR